MPRTRRVVIDTDGGVDDAAALWFALTEPTLEVVAITTVAGNVDVDTATANALRVVHAAGADVPVARGSSTSFGPPANLPPGPRLHGADGLGDTDRAPAPRRAVTQLATDLLRQVVRASPGAISVATIGPLTNLARVISDDPEWVSLVAEVVVMGGAIGPDAAGAPEIETNIGLDPLAAHEVIAAPWPRSPLLVGLDVTRHATLTDTEFDLLAARHTGAAQFLDEPLRHYRRFASRHSRPGECPCHDLLAVMALADPDVIVESTAVPLIVDTDRGARFGATVIASDTSQRHWRVARRADVDRFRARFRALVS
jgi:purine nucleosidase